MGLRLVHLRRSGRFRLHRGSYRCRLRPTSVSLSIPSKDLVVAVSAEDEIGTGVNVRVTALSVAVDQVVSDFAMNRVVAIATDERVVVHSGKDLVVAVSAEDEIGAGINVRVTVLSVAIDQVVSDFAMNRVVPVATGRACRCPFRQRPRRRRLRRG